MEQLMKTKIKNGSKDTRRAFCCDEGHVIPEPGETRVVTNLQIESSAKAALVKLGFAFEGEKPRADKPATAKKVG